MEDDDTLARVQEKSLAVLTDTCGRAFRREASAREQQGELSAEWLAKHRDYCRDSLAISAGILGACSGADGAAVAVAVTLYVEKNLQAGERTPTEAAIQLREYILAAAAAKGSA
jgi:hypothetical protein